ncbi:hypothetical protein [Allorhizobium terrae]|uniref:HNH endonuclease n=1 Tax=Allorhizobium terrae TaxID=1848972 RepID=A0A4S4A110_9HYPH|nr:hypothetical protein [Allorhizobium terrae]THF52006.1 hypothetical protein E6C51_04020 [Allorhizobium terrae]
MEKSEEMKSKSQIARTPPPDVRLELRREVGFGCPLCGNPHLEYHHFDPPWRINKHHSAEGMIALCARHHNEADSGAFTNEQLRNLKKNNHTRVQSKFNWRRKHTVFACGGNYAYDCTAMLTARGIDMIYFEKDDDGYDTLSLKIYDTCLNPIAVMRKNDWICRNNVDEIEATPRTPKLIIKSKIHRIDFELFFKDRGNMNETEIKVLDDFNIPEYEEALLVKVRGKLPAPCSAIFSDDRLIVDGRLFFSGNKFISSNKAIVLG